MIVPPQLSRSFLKKLLNELTETELKLYSENRGKPVSRTSREIGQIEFGCPLGAGTIPVCIFQSDQQESSYQLCQLVDGRIEIHIRKEEFDVVFLKNRYETFFPMFMAAIAHEIGHLLCGHLKKGSPQMVDRKRDRQVKFAHDNDISLKRAVRTSVSGILAGGVLEDELEADKVAARFVGIIPMIAVHSYETMISGNLATEIETWNRCQRLFEMARNEDVREEENWTLGFRFNSDEQEVDASDAPPVLH